jgi:hypothetical protein
VVAGLAAQVPSAAATPATLRDQGRAALRPLMEVDSVRATLGDDRPRGAQPATPLPVARSAVPHLRRDDPGSGRRVPAEVLAPTPGQQAEIDHRTAEAERFLQEVLGGSPVWLGAANAFAAAPTGRQLREIASSRLVKAIHPNRRLGA